MQQIPDFASAVTEFQKYLTREDTERELVWFFREDILLRRNLVWIRWPLPEENLLCAQERYEWGIQIGPNERNNTGPFVKLGRFVFCEYCVSCEFMVS